MCFLPPNIDSAAGLFVAAAVVSIAYTECDWSAVIKREKSRAEALHERLQVRLVNVTAVV